jgi:hypothetical protein
MIAIAGICTAAVDESEVLIRRVYAVSDLPVFKDSKDGTEYDASILIAHLQATVAPKPLLRQSHGCQQVLARVRFSRLTRMLR